MKLLFLGIYTLPLVIVWGFYVIARIHAKKFENFSPNISKFLNLLFIFLLVLSISGYLIIIFGNFSGSSFEIFNNNGGSVNISKPIFGENITY